MCISTVCCLETGMWSTHPQTKSFPQHIHNRLIEADDASRRLQRYDRTISERQAERARRKHTRSITQRTGQLHNALPSSADVCVTCLVNGGITVPSRPIWSRTSEVPPWSCCTCGQGSESLRIKCHRGQGLAVLGRWECMW
jgi:hypothetical protein